MTYPTYGEKLSYKGKTYILISEPCPIDEDIDGSFTQFYAEAISYEDEPSEKGLRLMYSVLWDVLPDVKNPAELYDACNFGGCCSWNTPKLIDAHSWIEVDTEEE